MGHYKLLIGARHAPQPAEWRILRLPASVIHTDAVANCASSARRRPGGQPAGGTLRLPRPSRNGRDPDSWSAALKAIAGARFQTQSLARWRPLRDEEAGQADLDHAVRRFYGDGS
jgi:hypothetical protein